MQLFDSLPVIDTTQPPIELQELSLPEKVAAGIASIKRQLAAGKHLLCAFSAGKDSTTTLNLALTAMRELIAEGVTVPTLHVMHSATRLDNPVIQAYNERQIEKVRAYAQQENLPVKVWIASPGLSNDYLVGLIGGRLIASVGASTKCQQMMKAAPLDRLRREIRAEISASLGRKLKPGELVTLVGTRFEESAQRARMMTARGESATDPVNLAAEDGGDNWVLSPIAEMSTLEVFEYIGWVRSGRYAAYDSFDDLIETYRDMNNGDCMVNVFLAGRETERPACGSRTGCWACTRITRDSSAENMIAKEGGEYVWLKPLNDLRNYLRARHFDPSARCWLARSVDPETGTVKILPNAYSPAFTQELLGIVLTIQLDEIEAAERAGIKPRFQLLDLQQLIAIELLWSRYGYQKPFTAMRMFLEVYEQGVRHEIPDVSALPTFNEADIRFPEVEVPFCDEEYNDLFNGLRNVEAAAADAESLTLRKGEWVTDVRTGGEFEIDEEAANLFVSLDLDYALSRVSLDQSPSAAAHYLFQLGTVAIYKSSHGEWERMLRMSNQIYRSGLQTILHDRAALIARLGGKNTGQMDLF